MIADTARQNNPASGSAVQSLAGLTSADAARLLKSVGLNTVTDPTAGPLKRVLEKLWAPVPWMLEATIVLELILQNYTEATVIIVLLGGNVAIQYFQEGQANATLDALKSRLALNVMARRDGAFKQILAINLVPGDVIQLTLGKIVAADAKIGSGEVLVDQSMLTGESLPVEMKVDDATYAGALIRRGEAEAVVTSTGPRTKFGKTAELIRTAHSVSSQQKAVLKMVRSLAIFSSVVIITMSGYAIHIGLGFRAIVPLILTAILAAIPVALPATFTLTAALAARQLAKVGILSTRLSAVNEAATMDVLCVDKTGTLTLNELSVASLQCAPDADEAQVLTLASMASSQDGGDPVDAAVVLAASGKRLREPPKLIEFKPFDPALKTAGATVQHADGTTLEVMKGAFSVVAAEARCDPIVTQQADALEKAGSRVVAVAVGPHNNLAVIGLIAIRDTPRADAKDLIAELKANGITTVMVTGDAAGTAAAIANDVGIASTVAPSTVPSTADPATYGVYAGVLPEDKYALVKAFQLTGHTVGMCGDGANDAPALRQAQIGIAVSTATDVAKSAAGLVLTQPGLPDILAAIKAGRSSFQRILTYSLNMILKKIATVSFVAVGFFITREAILTPLLMVIIMVTGDFLAMALTVDRVEPSRIPNVWKISHVTLAGVLIGCCLLCFCLSIFAFAHFHLRLPIEQLRTVTFLVLVFGGQSTLYAVRDRHHLFKPTPNRWLILSSILDLAIASSLAVAGIAMAAVSPLIVFSVLGSAIAFGLLLNGLKIPVFRHLAVA